MNWNDRTIAGEGHGDRSKIDVEEGPLIQKQYGTVARFESEGEVRIEAQPSNASSRDCSNSRMDNQMQIGKGRVGMRRSLRLVLMVAMLAVAPVAVHAQFVSVISSTPSQTSATIAWTTCSSATGQVNYGTSTSYSSSVSSATLTTAHSLTISGLTAGTLYHYQIVSKDSTGAIVSTGDSTFSTTGTGTTSGSGSSTITL